MNKIKLDPREKRALKNAFRGFLPVLLLILVLLSVGLSYWHFSMKQNEVVDLEEKLTIDAALDYNHAISNLASILYSIKLEYNEIASNEASPAEIDQLFTQVISDNPTIDQLRILDLDGMETHRVNKGFVKPYVVPEEDLQDKSTRYYYRETKFLGRNQFLFSNIDLNIENNAIEIDSVTGLTKPTFRISTPIVIKDQRRGYLVVNFLMRDFLTDMWYSLADEGGNVLMFNEYGCMLNYPNDDYNFKLCYDSGNEKRDINVETIYPKVDLTQKSGSFISNNEIHTYVAYKNISNLSKDYFLSEISPEHYYFMVSFGRDSAYGDYIDYHLLKSVLNSWKLQVPMLVVGVIFYLILILMIFLNDRVRFTNFYSDNRYKRHELKRAIQNNEFICFYQPVINIQDGSILGFEALTRWQRGDQLLQPNMFFDEINNYELKKDLDENTYRNIKMARKRLEELNINAYSFFSINITHKTFECMIKDNPDTIINFSEKEKEYFLVELLEEIIIHDEMADRIHVMNDDSVLFAVDDFGTGNSNVAFIRNFENLKVKIDKVFVPKDLEDEEERVIIESFVKMFGDKGLKLIVEGVETREQYLYLKNLNVAGAQGFYFSKPLPLDELIAFMQQKTYLEKL